MQIELEEAFVLSSKPFRETSLLVEFFTKNFGRISLIAKGAKRKKGCSNLLQPFVPLLISYFGKTNLYTLKQAEQNGLPFFLSSTRLISGLYLNELLIKFLPPEDFFPEMFSVYTNTLQQLSNLTAKLEIPLRYFEKELLKSIGYELQLQREFDSNKEIDKGKFYQYIVGKGAILCEERNQHLSKNNTCFNGVFYSGASLIALRENNISTIQEIIETKQLMRKVIGHYLEGKPINVRKMFASVKYPH